MYEEHLSRAALTFRQCKLPGGSLKAAGLGDGGTLVAGGCLISSQAIPKLRLRLPLGKP